jgi:predicted  nucleic acid-binding Zn-ribbon protein
MTLLGDKVKDSSDKVEKNVVPSLNLTERTKINRQIDDLDSKIKIYKDSIDRISKTIERVNKEKDALSRDSDLGTAAFTDLLKGHQSKKDSLESELNGFETKKKELLAQLKGSVEKPSEEVKKDKEKKETVKEKSDTSFMDRIVNRIGMSRQKQKSESK